MEQSTISQDLFDKIRSRFEGMQMADAEAKTTLEPTEAKFFTFEVNTGEVSVSIADPKSMKVFYAKDITDGMTEDVMDQWQGFLKELRFFAKRHMMTFDPRDIQKSNLDKRDFEFMAKENMTEARSNMFGSRRSSFQTLDKTKLIIRHSKNVDEEVPGSRSRSIKALFIENGEGERFKYPFKHLAGARAMQQHVAHGGYPYDNFGQHIIDMSESLAKLRTFDRYVSRHDLMNDDTNTIVEKSRKKSMKLKKAMERLNSARGYEQAFENFKDAEEMEVNEETLADWKDKFTVKTFDENIGDILPLVYKIVNEQDDDDFDVDKAETASARDAGYVAQWLNKGDPLVLKINDAMDKLTQKARFKDPNILLSNILRDIATRALFANPEDERVANFASDMAVEIESQGELFNRPSPDFAKSKKIAVDLARRYVADIKKIQSDPKQKDALRKDPAEVTGGYKDIKGKTVKNKDLGYKKDKYKLAQSEFESWADDKVEKYENPNAENTEIPTEDANTFKRLKDEVDDFVGQIENMDKDGSREFINPTKLADELTDILNGTYDPGVDPVNDRDAQPEIEFREKVEQAIQQLEKGRIKNAMIILKSDQDEPNYPDEDTEMAESQEKEIHIDLDGLSDELPDNDVPVDRILKLAGLIN